MTTVDRAAPPSGRRSRRSRRDRIGYLPYLLPGLIAFTVVILIPFGMNIWYSLHKWKGGNAPLRWYGLGNYTDLLADEQLRTATGRLTGASHSASSFAVTSGPRRLNRASRPSSVPWPIRTIQSGAEPVAG